MKIAVSISAQRRCARIYASLFALLIGAALMGADSASAKEPFTAFTYAAAPVLSSPGQGSQACMDTGVPLCPSGHTCDYYGYIGNAVGTPGFGKTNIEVCIKEEDPEPRSAKCHRRRMRPSVRVCANHVSDKPPQFESYRARSGGADLRGRRRFHPQPHPRPVFDPGTLGRKNVDLLARDGWLYCVSEYLWHDSVGAVAPEVSEPSTDAEARSQPTDEAAFSARPIDLRISSAPCLTSIQRMTRAHLPASRSL